MRRPSALLSLAVAIGLVACARQAATPKAQPGASPAAAASPSGAAAPAAADPFPIDDKTPLPDPLPRVAARVDGQPIPTVQVVVIAEEALQKKVLTDKIRAYRQVLNQLVVRELLLAEALRRKLAPDSAAVEQAYDASRVRYKDDAEWNEFLRTQGLTPDEYRAELRAKQTVDLLLSQEAQAVPEPSAAEAREFYAQNPSLFETAEQLRVARILVRVPPPGAAQLRAAARTKAGELLRRLRSGVDFGRLARQYSEDAASAGLGGVLPPFERGERAKPFEDAAWALKPGSFSEVVETPEGFELIRLLERIAPRQLEFEEVEGPLLNSLAQKRRQQRLQELVDRLRAGAKIETFL